LWVAPGGASAAGVRGPPPRNGPKEEQHPQGNGPCLVGAGRLVGGTRRSFGGRARGLTGCRQTMTFPETVALWARGGMGIPVGGSSGLPMCCIGTRQSRRDRRAEFTETTGWKPVPRRPAQPDDLLGSVVAVRGDCGTMPAGPADGGGWRGPTRGMSAGGDGSRRPAAMRVNLRSNAGVEFRVLSDDQYRHIQLADNSGSSWGARPTSSPRIAGGTNVAPSAAPVGAGDEGAVGGIHAVS